jgi:AcrR family transcriptional regulator
MAHEQSTRERIVTEAIRLFAERGYRGTTVGEIEAAAGLAPRSGGLYKHFRSKEEVLQAGIERHVSELEQMRPVLDMLPLGDLRAELRLIARWALNELSAEQPLMRVVQKDGDQFPELVAQVKERIIDPGHREAARLIGRMLTEVGAAPRDEEAIGSVALGALVAYKIEETMFGSAGIEVSEERLIDAWVEILMTVAEAAAAQAGTTVAEAVAARGDGQREVSEVD